MNEEDEDEDDIFDWLGQVYQAPSEPDLSQYEVTIATSKDTGEVIDIKITNNNEG